MLGSAIGNVEEIVYDPKVSQTKEYVRARNILDVANPAKNLNLPTGETVTINYEYEKLRKRCFHCQRLTHEKAFCPLLRKQAIGKTEDLKVQEKTGENFQKGKGRGNGNNIRLLEVPPGFPPMFPELSKAYQQMALQYIAHADPTERLARIQRVQQSIDDKTA